MITVEVDALDVIEQISDEELLREVQARGLAVQEEEPDILSPATLLDIRMFLAGYISPQDMLRSLAADLARVPEYTEQMETILLKTAE